MIIVSQKKEVINFDNVTRIFIADFSEDGFGIGADTNSVDSQCWDLGYYETEQRAKEILEEVTIAYANITMMNMPKINIHEFIPAKEIIRNLVYQMPEK